MSGNTYQEKYYKKVQFFAFFQLLMNLFLAILKLIGGILSFSSALISDSVDSFGDVVTSFIGLIGVKTSSKKADEGHQFGHEKIENLVSLIFSMVLIVSVGMLLYNSISSIVTKEYLDLERGNNILLGILFCAISLFFKLSMSVLIFIQGKRLKSPLLKAQALDHILDSIGTSLTIIALIIIYCLPSVEWVLLLDPIASIIISIVILTGALKIAYENSATLIDKSCPKDIQDKIKEFILKIDGVQHIDSFRSRIAASRIFLEIEITVGGELKLYDAHKISEEVKDNVLSTFPEVKNCLVHINPPIHDDGEKPFK